MESLDIMLLQIEETLNMIESYGNTPSIGLYRATLREAVDKGSWKKLIYVIHAIIEWYTINLKRIKKNEWYFGQEDQVTANERIIEIEKLLLENEELYIKELQNIAIDKNSNVLNTIETLATILNKFHLVVRQLRQRHNDRNTLDVSDEYDVQDLLHSLLTLNFEDIRAEEWTPSYAGTSARQDFLLKNEKIVIEVKMTRKGLGNKEAAEQLIIDIAKYKTHPDCKSLICFVYDPDGRIKNPRGFEQDIMKTEKDLDVKVYVRPM